LRQAPVWLTREEPEEPASLPELALRRAPVWLARGEPEESVSLPELALQRAPDASPGWLAQHSVSERSLPDVLPASQELDVPRGGPVQGGPVLSAPEEPRWGGLPEQQVLRAPVRLGEPPERAGRPAARSACCGRRAKPRDAHRGRP
jgi:hypothetical protein